MEESQLYQNLNSLLYSTNSLVILPNTGIDPSQIMSGTQISAVSQNLGNFASGKVSFTDTTEGYILGVNSQGIPEFYIGNATNFLLWDGTNLTVTGSLTADSINIPDNVSANSFHTDSSGNSWWGAVLIAGATAKVLNTGAATFSNITITGGSVGGWTTTATSFYSTGITLTSGASASIAFGTTVPTSPTLGTGIYIDKTGLFGLNTNTQNFKIDATNGNITAIAGAIGGFTISATALYAGTTGTRVQLDTTSGIHLGATVFASAPFRVALDGTLTATSATITGAITASSGSIGSFTIGTYLYTGTKTAYNDTNAGVHLGSDGIGIGNNVFTVSSAGALVATSATITGAVSATSGSIGGFTITSTTLYGGVIKTAATVGAGNTGVIMDTAGLRGYDSVLGETFNLPTNGSAPTFSSGVITETIFNISTNAILRTSLTVGDGSASSAGVLINNSGIYGCGANQTLSNANFKILNTGSGSIVLGTTGFIEGGQTDFNTGVGFFLGYESSKYKFSVGDPASSNFFFDGTSLSFGNLPAGGGASNLFWDFTGTGKIYIASSSLRYKKNVILLNDDFGKILELKPKKFNWKRDNSEDIGYIAEDVEKLGLKNLVNYNRKGEPESIKYDRISLYLLEIIKKQQIDIEFLKNNILNRVNNKL